MDPTAVPLEITVKEAHALARALPAPAVILDVREPDELAICQVPGAQAVPMRQIPAQLAAIPRDRHVLTLCHHGKRSLAVAHFLRDQGYAASSIAGGIDAWAEEIDPAMARY